MALRIEQACFRFALVLAITLPLCFRFAELENRRRVSEAAAMAGTLESNPDSRLVAQLQRVAAFDRAAGRDRIATYISPALALLAFYVVRWVVVGRVRPVWPLRRTSEA